MKFCIHCGEVIDDNVLVCPKCGKATNSKVSNTSNSTLGSTPSSNTNYTYNNSSNVSNSQLQPVLMAFSILASLAVVVGVILLIIGGIQEFRFRQEYDLSDLTDAGINLVRKYSNYSNSITFLTAGGITTGVGLLLDLVILSYRLKQKKGGQ